MAIDAHGNSGFFKIGNQYVTLRTLKHFTGGLKGKISQLRLFSCKTGQDMKFICQLERLLGCDVVSSTGSNWDIPPDKQDETGQHWFTDGELTSWEPDNKIAMDITGMLQAPMDEETGWMIPMFLDQGILPMVEPFSDHGFTYNYPFIPGIESEVLEPLPYYPILPVDWVRLEVIDPLNPSIPLASQPALITTSGQIIDPEGAPLLTWDFDLINFTQDSIFIHIRPMRHVPVRTPNFQVDSFFDVVFEIEFNAVSGDTNFDNVINAADRSNTWNFRNAVGYLPWDINLDGVVNAQDRTVTWNNRNTVGPTNTNE